MNEIQEKIITDAGFTIVSKTGNGYRLCFKRDETVFYASVDYKPSDMSWLTYVIWLYGCASRVSGEDDGK